jgi:hypothetical protein
MLGLLKPQCRQIRALSLLLNVKLSANICFTYTCEHLRRPASAPIRVALEGFYELSKRAAAALIMHNAIVKEIPPESHENLATIMEHEDLRDKVVIEKAYACDAYYYFVRKNSLAGLRVNFSLETAISADGKVGGGWASNGDEGVARFSGKAGGPRVYYPIYALKCLNNKRFFSKDVPAIRFRSDMSGQALPVELPMQDFTLPWGELDDDGDEIWPAVSCFFASLTPCLHDLI